MIGLVLMAGLLGLQAVQFDPIETTGLKIPLSFFACVAEDQKRGAALWLEYEGDKNRFDVESVGKEEIPSIKTVITAALPAGERSLILRPDEKYGVQFTLEFKPSAATGILQLQSGEKIKCKQYNVSGLSAK